MSGHPESGDAMIWVGEIAIWKRLDKFDNGNVSASRYNNFSNWVSLNKLILEKVGFNSGLFNKDNSCVEFEWIKSVSNISS